MLGFFFPIEHPNYKIPVIIISGIILGGFSFYFILRDLFLYFFRRIGFTAQRMIMVLVIAGVGFNILGIYMFVQAKQSDSGGFLGSIIEMLISYNPFTGPYGAYKFVITALVLGLATLFSYPRRQAYFE